MFLWSVEAERGVIVPEGVVNAGTSARLGAPQLQIGHVVCAVVDAVEAGCAEDVYVYLYVFVCEVLSHEIKEQPALLCDRRPDKAGARRGCTTAFFRPRTPQQEGRSHDGACHWCAKICFRS